MENAAALADEQIQLSSVLPDSYSADLEALMFFNPGQRQLCAGIEASIAKHGLPEIVVENAMLRVRVGSRGDTQTVFALEGNGERSALAGAIVFVRHSVEEMVVLHIAVRQQESSDEPPGHSKVAFRLVQCVRQAARQLKGVRWMTLYGSDGPVRLRV